LEIDLEKLLRGGNSILVAYEAHEQHTRRVLGD